MVDEKMDALEYLRKALLEGSGLCPSCATRRAVEAGAHVEATLPFVARRQWTLSKLPARVDEADRVARGLGDEG